MTVALSPPLVREIIRTEETPLRCRRLSVDQVEKVFRYGAPVGSRISRVRREGRCMDRARRLIATAERQGKSFPSGMILMADELTGGRGRFERPWHAPSGGLWLTLVLVNTLLPESARLYSLAAGLACCEALRAYRVAACLKWVNDVHVGGRKVAGILIETCAGPESGEEYVLIGVGVNVNNQAFPGELAGRAVSLTQVLGTRIDLELFAARLIAKFSWNIGLLHFEEQQRLDRALDQEPEPDHPVVSAWCQLSDTIGRRVWFGYDVQRKPQYQAEVLGLDPAGGLILKPLDGGGVVVERAGEIIYLD